MGYPTPPNLFNSAIELLFLSFSVFVGGTAGDHFNRFVDRNNEFSGILVNTVCRNFVLLSLQDGVLPGVITQSELIVRMFCGLLYDHIDSLNIKVF